LGASVGMAVENAVIESAQQKSAHASTALFSPQDGFGFVERLVKFSLVAAYRLNARHA
jgi:hypothetical protein